MEQFMPLEFLKNNLKANIHKLSIISKKDNVAFYEAITDFGYMTLIVESIIEPSKEQNSFQRNDISLIDRISQRNKLIDSQIIVTPLIYEQQLIKVREDYIICMTLCEPITFCHGLDLIQLKIQTLFENLVKCAYKISTTQFAYGNQQYSLQKIVKSTNNGNFYLDFTTIVFKSIKDNQKWLEIFKESLSDLMQQNQKNKMQELSFMCECPFIFNIDKIRGCQSSFELALIFNLLQEQKVTVISQSRSKVFPINKLGGQVNLERDGVTYQKLQFKSGLCLSGIKQITFEDLKNRFFEQNTIYYITKQKYLCVKKEPVRKQEAWIASKIQYSDFIYVKPEVSKVQFINFLIAYIRFIEPILHEINFQSEQNVLQLVFTNRQKNIRKIAIKFHKRYIVKDEELSMIIEKSKLKQASISLESMNFGDSFLIFLANCDKMQQVKSFNISNCKNITQSGINLLVGSPFCKNISTLKICSLPLPDVELIKTKMKLKQLFINNCVNLEQNQNLNIKSIDVQRLESIGVYLDLNLNSNIKYLSISQDVSIDQLKLLSKLPLVELKIKLIENKKSISSFIGTISSLYTKDNPIKSFSDGGCSKSLKILDISNSTVRLKDIKQILHIQTLQSLICNGIDKDKFYDAILPHHIISLSLCGSRITAELLQAMTQRINFFIKLSIINTDINSNNLEQSIKGKKYINLLELGQQQIDLNFFAKKGCIEGLEVHLNKLNRDENEPILNHLLYKQINVCKQLNFRCETKHEGRLVRKIHRFLTLYQDNLWSATKQLSLCVNSIPFLKLAYLQPIQNINEYFIATSKKGGAHKINAHMLLAQQYKLPIVKEFLSIDLFNVSLHKIIRIYPDCLLQICIRNNRILSKQVVSLIEKYAGDRLVSLDFRNCLFTYQQVCQQLYKFPYLESVNEGQYEVRIRQEDQCELELQKVLKFFMKLSQRDKMKIHLFAFSISERQLYFSIMYEILHHHAANIILLSVHFQNIASDHYSLQFWSKIFLLEKLETLSIYYFNDFHSSQENQMALAVQFQKLINLNLGAFSLETSIHLIIPEELNFSDLKKLKLTYSDLDINQIMISKLLRGAPTLSIVNISMRNCNLTSLIKISQALQKMGNLSHLNLSFQNSPLKESSLFDLIENLHKNARLQRVELNINNCLIAINDLIRVCLHLVNRIKFCHMAIFALQARRPAFFYDHNQLLAQGIELIFTS